MKISEISIRNRNENAVEELTALWNRSVRTTHHFLTEEDIENLQPIVEQAVSNIPELAISVCGGAVAGFIGVDGDKIEMLFVAPEFMGKGVGHSLIEWALNECNARRIDVNEQNGYAAAIYKHWGFKVYDRTETDEQGNPFPILRMRHE